MEEIPHWDKLISNNSDVCFDLDSVSRWQLKLAKQIQIDTKTRAKRGQSQVPDFNLLTFSGRPVFYVTSTMQDKILQPWLTVSAVFHGNSIYCSLAQF